MTRSVRIRFPDRLPLILRDDSGFIVSAELIVVVTLLICSVGVGFAVVKDAVATELNDISDAIGTFDQSFTINGLQAEIEGGSEGGADFHSECAGFGFSDSQDQCDCQVILIVSGNITIGGGNAQLAGGGGGAGAAAAQAQAVGAFPAAAPFATQTLIPAPTASTVQATDALVPVLVDSVIEDSAANRATVAPSKVCPPTVETTRRGI